MLRIVLKPSRNSAAKSRADSNNGSPTGAGVGRSSAGMRERRRGSTSFIGTAPTLFFFVGGNWVQLFGELQQNAEPFGKP
jgi:hypothetical protein